MESLPLSEHLALRFDGLWQWMSRKYRLDVVPLSIGNRDYRIYKLGDPDQAVEAALASNSSDEASPYWGEIWPSAPALATFVSERPESLSQPVLELGCGTGLPGIIAGSYSDAVVLSDIAPDALRLAEINWILNHRRAPIIRQIDWQRPPTDQRYPLILAADLAYEQQLFKPLLRTFEQMLAPEGEIWLSEPNRPFTRDFFLHLQEHRFVWEKFSQNVTFAGINSDIAVYIIRRNDHKG